MKIRKHHQIQTMEARLILLAKFDLRIITAGKTLLLKLS